jgi:hypothetical protein
MAKYKRGFGEHLAPLPGFETIDSDSSSSSDSEVEVVSTYDAAEHELVQLGEYLRLGSDSDKDADTEDEEKENNFPSHSLVSYSASDDSDDGISSMATCRSPPHAIDLPITDSSRTTSSVKRKRKQWSIREKLHAISTFEKNNSKYRTSKSHGCSPAQLRKWLAAKDQLQAVSKEKSGSFGIARTQNVSIDSCRPICLF